MVKRILLRDHETTSGSSSTPLMSGLALTCGCYEDICLRNSPEMIPDRRQGLSTPCAGFRGYNGRLLGPALGFSGSLAQAAFGDVAPVAARSGVYTQHREGESHIYP